MGELNIIDEIGQNLVAIQILRFLMTFQRELDDTPFSRSLRHKKWTLDAYGRERKKNGDFEGSLYSASHRKYSLINPDRQNL